jgi:hypothetical protein
MRMGEMNERHLEEHDAWIWRVAESPSGLSPERSIARTMVGTPISSATVAISDPPAGAATSQDREPSDAKKAVAQMGYQGLSD